jgi:hypothetical protein
MKVSCVALLDNSEILPPRTQAFVGWVRRTRDILGKQRNLICVVTQHIYSVEKENILHQFKDGKLPTRSCWVTAESIFSFLLKINHPPNPTYDTVA